MKAVILICGIAALSMYAYLGYLIFSDAIRLRKERRELIKRIKSRKRIIYT